MKTNQELLQERKTRLNKAITLEKPDRTPVVLMADAFCASHMGVKLADFCTSLKMQNQTMVNSIKALGDVDGMNAAFAAGPLFPLIFMTYVKLPGRELPENSLWQLDEKEVMLVEDYDTILNKGWGPFMQDYLVKRLNYPLEGIMGELAETPQMVKNFEKEGYCVYSPIIATAVPELLGGGRSMPKFMRDLYKIPDKVEAVLDAIQKESLEILRQQIRATDSTVVFISPARGASEFFSPKLWQRFVWKYLKETVDVVIEEGAFADIHIDSNWERDLEFFRSLPKGKCIFETDGATDIYKVKEVIGDMMCIKGDVPAAKLALGTPDDVYNYSAGLVKDMGPGFILSSGCSIPPNAKVENVKAMIAAATGK
ncbi:MAG TPA: uroporphyrinogen decarboxylase family protein [Methylomusa anaerophila]|uniref:Methylcobalamin:coenzyme M methyltransferase n=1 Tax=Methylomusa anaerophila TaxID=1930071 RepID=A0A348AJ55_9FIRM|nr:uroporphyrinogen decarboxylase family protein [Methylomusa anaerophila]BBB91103.1 methylcobalamin:coenzyme M methyltransferase [Methylomusa anaerophila]HML88980.1 uroporphyrinogen decarboxylase family protein [Methylomusa anaerophila]